jgi:hypothetical protein
MRARNPCVFARFRTFGWYVRFTVPPLCALALAQSRINICASPSRVNALFSRGTPSRSLPLRKARHKRAAPSRSSAENCPESVDTVENAGPPLVEPVDNCTAGVVDGRVPCYHRHAPLALNSASAPLKCAARHPLCAARPVPTHLGGLICSEWPRSPGVPSSPMCTFHRLRPWPTYFHSRREGSDSKRPLQAALLRPPACYGRPAFPTDVEEPVDKQGKPLVQLSAE